MAATGGHEQQPGDRGARNFVIAVVLGFFAVDTVQTSPETFTTIILLGLLAIVLDAMVRRRPRTPIPPEGIASASPTT